MKIGKWLKDSGICDSQSEGERLVKQGGIAFNKEKIPTDTKFIYFVGEKVYFSPVDVSKVKKLEHNGQTAFYLE